MLEEALKQLDSEQNRLIVTVAGAVIVGALLFYTWRAWQLRRARTRLHEMIIAVGTESLHNVLVPDGMGASMHVDYLLLTSRGVLVIDLRDLKGNIFGGDQMTDWTVMNGSVRSTFQNPQHALYDRVAAVRQLSGELPVEGRVLFTRRGKFPKGLPRWTLMVDSLNTEFPLPDSDAAHSWVDQYRTTWDRLCNSVLPSTLRKPRSFLAEVFTG